MFDLSNFISQHVTKRSKSMFLCDIEQNSERLKEKIKDKSILVIGGAGSIGSSFIKAVLPFKPKTLVVVDINENALAELTRDIRSTRGMYVPDDFVPYPMDYAAPVFEKMFRNRSGFDVVANFSAHKHVRSEKDIYSVEALIQNNILHTRKLLDLLVEFPPEEYFVYLRTKRANPVNIMGASKRIMEDVIFRIQINFPLRQRGLLMCIFKWFFAGGFLERLQKQQPLSAPSDVKRYFVSPMRVVRFVCWRVCWVIIRRFFPKT